MVLLTFILLSLSINLSGQCDPRVSISTPASSICQGSSVVFTAVPLNAGNAPVLQWKVNGVNTGTNSTILTSSTLNNNDRVWVELTPDPSCPVQTTVSSNVITMTVNSLRTPQVSIYESINPVCPGQPVTFTATDIIEGGLNPSFEWKVNGIPAGTNSSTFTSALNNNDIVQLTMVSDVICAVNPALSNSVTVEVLPLPVLNTVIPDQVYCTGIASNPIVLSGEPSDVVFSITGGSSVGLADQTEVSAVPSFNPIAGSALVTVTPLANSCAGQPVSFNVTVNPDPAAISPGNLQFCSGVSTSPFPLSGTPGNVTFDISGGGAVGLSDQYGISMIPAFTPVTGNAVVTLVPRANNCTGQPVSFSITVHQVPVVVSPGDLNFCNGIRTQGLPLTGTPSGVTFDISGGSLTGLPDQTSVSSIPSFMPVTGDAIITLIPHANGCPGQPVTFNIHVNPTPTVSPVTVPLLCEGVQTTSIPLTGTPANVLFNISGGSSIGLQDVTGVSSIPAFSPVAGAATLSVIPVANGCTGSPVNLSITVNQVLPAGVSISASANPVCVNTPVTFTAIPVNGGPSPTYQWNVNGISQGSNSPLFTYTPLNGDRISVSLTSSLPCASGNPATSNIIAISVFQGPPAAPPVPVARDGQANSLCPVAAGLEYHVPSSADAVSYTWNFPAGWTITSGQGTNSVTVTAGIQSAGNKNITVTAVNPCGSSTSAPLVVTVATFASVEAGPDQTVCAGTASVRMNGSIAGATGNNDWNWSAPAGTFTPNDRKLNADYNIPASIINGGSVTVTITARAEGTCPVSTDQMTINIRPEPAATIQISGLNPVCAGSTSSVRINATPNTTVIYRINSGGNQSVSIGAGGSAELSTGIINSTTTYSLVSIAYADQYACMRTLTGSAIITVNPAAVVNAGPDQVVCASSPAVILAGSVSGGAISGLWSGGTGTFLPGNTALNATYIPSQSEITAGSLTLTLTSNDPEGPCNAASDNILITINPVPVVNAGSPQTICSGSAVNLSGIIGGSASSASWAGGTGSFSPGSGSLNAVYTPGPADISAGHVTLFLTTNDPAGPCSAATSQVEITINPSVSVNAGPDQVICGGSIVTLSGMITGGTSSGTWSGGTGTFSNAGSLNAVYTPGPGDISAGFVLLNLTSSDPEGPCNPVNDQIRITINTQPLVNAGPDQIICAGSNVTLAGSLGGSATTGTWSGGSGSFSPNAASMNAVYTPAPAEVSSGSVILTLTTNDPAGVCTAVSDQVTIIINQLPTVSAGQNQTICSNNAAALSGTIGGSASSATWSGGTGTFSPGANALNAIYTPGLAERNGGTVTLTLTTNDPEGPCGRASSSVTITIRKAVQITTQPSNVGVCASFPATFSVVASGDQLSYQWYRGNTPVQNTANINGSSSASLHFNQVSLADAGSYHIVVSGAAQCTPVTSNEVTLNVDQAITIITQPVSLTVCSGSASVFNVVADANGDPLVYQWRKNGTSIPGATSSTYTINSTQAIDAGVYTVLIGGTSGYMCSSLLSASASLTLAPNVGTPVFTMGAISSRCQGGGTVIYTASAQNSTGLTYSLDPTSISAGNTINSATGAVTFSPLWSGTSQVTATAAGCNGPSSALHTITITPTVSTPVFAMGTSSSRCQGGGSVLYTATAFNSTGITYSLDAASIAAGNTINLSTGQVTYTTSWNGVTTITASAAGCNGPVLSTHNVTVHAISNGGTISPVSSIICYGAGAGTLTLSGYNGTILNWEYTTDAGSSWTPVAITSATYTPAISQSTIFRAVVQNGTCPAAYSSAAMISVIPLSNPVITVTPQTTTICQGQTINLAANSGTLDGPFMNGSFTDANPVGWCRDQTCIGDFLPAHRDNETTGPWGETNGPKEFAGTTYDSQSGKFAVTGGNLTSMLETPLFSLFGNPPAMLYLRTAYVLVNGAFARIEISTNGGASYTTLNQFTGTSGNNLNFRQDQIDISSYMGQTNLRIRFTFFGSLGSSWAIDDVMVNPAGPPPIINYSWISDPPNVTLTGSNITVSPAVTTTYILTTSITTPYGTCPLGSSSVTITVNPLPVCTITGADGPVCPGSDNIYSAPSGMSRYSWSITGNGAILTSGSNRIITVRSGPACNSGYTLSLTVTDINGCASTCSKTVSVIDNTAPVINGCPANQVFCEVPGHTYSIPILTNISDACAGVLSVTFRITGATVRNGSGNDATGLFNNGISTITWTVSDPCGNVSTCTTIVNVNPSPSTSPIYHR